MAVLGNMNLSLLDLSKRLDPDNQVADIIEILKLQNEILDDAVFIEGNLIDGHKTTIRTGIPSVSWRRLNKGVAPQKSETAQVKFSTATMAHYSEIDKKIVDLSGPQIRFTEDVAAIQAINEELTRTMFYGNEKTNEVVFTGLSEYYANLTDESADNIIDAQGTGSGHTLASIWLVGWSDMATTGIVPKNSTAGVQVTDRGLVTVENQGGTGLRMEAYRTYFELDAGLAVQDWRTNVRIANINREALTADASSGADLPDLMFSALERIPNLGAVRPVFYMERYLREMLRKQLASKVSSSTLTFEDVGGRRTAMFQEVPVRRVDALAVDEDRVVA